MIDERELVQRAVRDLVREEPSFESLTSRRDRKRRNKRIAAGIAGLSLFMITVLPVGIVGLSNRTQTPAVPGGAETGPEVSGPTSTDPSVGPDAGWMFSGLPPEGTPVSTPEEGELVAHYGGPLRGAGFVYVYADGRVISWGGVGNQGRDGIYERRLTPEGVELVRSGAVKAERFQLSSNPVPDDAWGDPEAKPYVPSRYGICVDPTHRDLLPLPAVALLGGPENRVEGCFEVTTREARTLDDILSDAGYERIVGGGGPFGVALTFDTSDRLGEITFQAFLPHGELLGDF